MAAEDEPLVKVSMARLKMNGTYRKPGPGSGGGGLGPGTLGAWGAPADRDQLSRCGAQGREESQDGRPGQGPQEAGRHLDDEHLGGEEQHERQADHELGFAHAEDARPAHGPQVTQKLPDAELALQASLASSKTRVPPDRSRRAGARLLRRVSCGDRL